MKRHGGDDARRQAKGYLKNSPGLFSGSLFPLQYRQTASNPP
ncbi:hypothetical protein [Eikenella corrodens]|nr:hypothetical protein [Eikenella corrodens]